MTSLFNEIIYKPLFNALVWFYNLAFNDLGVAIILLTVLVRIVLFPLFHKSLRHQRLLQELQPKIKKIQENYKNNKEKQTKAIMEFYKTEKVNPFTSIFLLLAQLPVLFGLYQIFAKNFSEEALVNLYSFVAKPAVINNSFLGLVDLSHPNFLVTGLATIAQYVQGKLSLPKTKPGEAVSAQEKASRQIVYFIPIITLIFLVNLPSAIGVYWIATTIFSIIQQIAVNRSLAHERITTTSRDNH